MELGCWKVGTKRYKYLKTFLNRQSGMHPTCPVLPLGLPKIRLQSGTNSYNWAITKPPVDYLGGIANVTVCRFND
jgi:hypothetical protein